MDAQRFDTLARSLSRTADRRGLVRGAVALAIAMPALGGWRAADAGVDSRRTCKGACRALPSRAGRKRCRAECNTCARDDKPCRRDGDCCSRECVQGSCRAGGVLGATVCQGQDSCTEGPRNSTVCGNSGSSVCICLVSVEGKPFCAREADCGLTCITDADCASVAGAGSACVRSVGFDNFCACSARTFCAVPCAAP